jgi:hypothetical protein
MAKILNDDGLIAACFGLFKQSAFRPCGRAGNQRNFMPPPGQQLAGNQRVFLRPAKYQTCDNMDYLHFSNPDIA